MRLICSRFQWLTIYNYRKSVSSLVQVKERVSTLCCPKGLSLDIFPILNHFMSLIFYYAPWKHQKARDSRGGGGGGVEKKNLETPGVNKKRSGISRHDQEKNNVEFPWVLVFDLGNSNGCDMIWWNFQGRSFILSGISKGKVTKKVCPFSKKYVLTSPCLDFFLE